MVEKRILMSKIWSYGSMVENNPEVKKYGPMVLWSKITLRSKNIVLWFYGPKRIKIEMPRIRAGFRAFPLSN